MKEYKVGASIIFHPEYYIMHCRKPGIDNGEVNKLGLYGGQFDPIEDNDTRDTASRELTEESGVSIPVESFRPQKSIFVKSERNNEAILTEADIFLIQLPIDVTDKMFRNGEPMTERDLRRAKALGELTSVAAEALTKNGVI
jgi:hypothetical protein